MNTKKLLLWLAVLCLFTLPALAGQPFQVDQVNRYDRMSRPYGQGYEPSIADNTLVISLPLLSDKAQGQLRAQLVPADPARMPIKADQSLEATALRRGIQVDGQETGLFRLSFRLALYKDRLNGEYPYSIQVKGQDASGQPLEQAFPFVLSVEDGVRNAEQSMLLADSLVAQQPLIVGEEGKLLVKLRNGSSTRMLERISVQLRDAAGEVLPQGSAQHSLPQLLPGESAEIAMPVTVLHKASAQPHSLTLDLSAALPGGEAVTSSQQFTLAVEQEPRLRLGQPQLAPKAMQGENLAFSLNVMNMGKGQLNNILMTFDLPGFSGGGSVLVGNLGPGESKLGNSNLRAGQQVGDMTGKLIIEYEDSYGRPYSTQLPISSTVVERPQVSQEAQADQQEKTQATNPREYIAWGLSGLLLLVLIVHALWSRRRIRVLEEKNL